MMKKVSCTRTLKKYNFLIITEVQQFVAALE